MLQKKLKTVSIFFFGVIMVLVTIFHWNSAQGIANGQTAPANAFVIYDDSLKNNFVNWSWSGDINLSDTANAESGNAIAFYVKAAWGGLYLHTDSGIDTASYSSLVFSAKTPSDAKFAVGAYDSNNQLTKEPVMLDGYGGQPGTSWKTYTIPLGDLNASGKQIKGISVMDKSGNNNTSLYVDNIHMVGSATAPTAAAITVPVTSTPTNVPAAPTATPTKAPAVTTAPKQQQTFTLSGNPLGGATLFNDPDSNPAAKQAQEWQSSRPADAQAIKKIADNPKATWLGNWNANIQTDTAARVNKAASLNAIPVFIAYNIPGRDCGNYSAGGAGNAQAYKDWINGMAAGIGSKRAVVVLEPDALAQDCLQGAQKQERYDLLRYAIQKLKSQGGTAVYLDAGHSKWVAANDMAGRLKNAGIDKADGFAVNVSNFQTTDSSVSYGQQIVTQVGGKHFIVDTARNGNGPAPDNAWCNPAGRALGERPTTSTGQANVDAFLWLKYPGESDGSCNGAPAAGQWYPDYALGLAKSAKW